MYRCMEISIEFAQRADRGLLTVAFDYKANSQRNLYRLSVKRLQRVVQRLNFESFEVQTKALIAGYESI